MEERSPNSEPDGSRRVCPGGQRPSAMPLVFDRPSWPVPEARLVRADWMFGNREARPGLR
jgi:hypothetical protein